MTYQFYAGDAGMALELTVVDASGVPVDLSSASAVALVLGAPDGATVKSRPMLVVDGPAGRARYTLDPGDLDQAGTWRYQVVASGPGFVRHSATLRLAVGPNVAG